MQTNRKFLIKFPKSSIFLALSFASAPIVSFFLKTKDIDPRVPPSETTLSENVASLLGKSLLSSSRNSPSAASAQYGYSTVDSLLFVVR